MKKTLIFLTIFLLTASAFANITLNSALPAKKAINRDNTRDLLYDQTSNPSSDGVSAAQDFVNMNEYDCWGADDFVVPADETWTIDAAFFAGAYWNGAGPGTGFGNAKIYSDAPGMPGTELFDIPACPVVDDGAGNLDITLSTPVVLTEGIYWFAWQHTVDFGVGGQWGVQPHESTNGSVWYWINPGGGFSAGTDWQACTAMWPGNAGTDLTYALYGTIEAEVLEPPVDVTVDDVAGTIFWSAPPVSGIIIEDNFDSYAVGDYLAVVGDDWTTWSNNPGGPEDALVTDAQSNSPSNSVIVELNNDLVLIMDNYTSGVYTIELSMFVPTGYCGYFNLQKTNVPGTEWAFQIYFQTDGVALADAGGAGALTYNFNHDEWMDLKLIVDLDNDWATYYHDDVEMIGYQYSTGCFGSSTLLSFGGVNIFGGANSAGPGDTPMFYFDNVVLSSGATRDLTGYNVYLDDMINPVTTVGTDVFEYTYEELVTGQEYTAGVSAVYDDGESEIIEVIFIYAGNSAGNVVIAATKLNSNYPNPFNPVTNIAYSIKDAGNVTIEVYNLKGQIVKTLVNEVKTVGDHTIIWDGTDNTNKSVSSGVYFYKMVSDSNVGRYTSTKKMILMK